MSSRQKELGQYMTPLAVGRQMGDLISRDVRDCVVIDPACGDGNLLMAVVERFIAARIPDIHRRIIGVDIDPEMAASSRKRLAKAMNCHPEQVRILCDDFLDIVENPLLFGPLIAECNVVISNPPYGKGREYEFLKVCNEIFAKGTELVFLMPLAFLDRAREAQAGVLKGKPLGVTTGHCIYHHICGHRMHLESTRRKRTKTTSFAVLSGVKLYELGAGIPPQNKLTLSRKPFSSSKPRPGWLPCVRTGDVEPFHVRLERLYVDHGQHLAHPKDLERFAGPRLFVRRMPVWGTRSLAGAYIEETALCAGDVLVVRHESDDVDLLKGLCVFINSPKTAGLILNHRPSVQHRVSFPKISGKDLEWLFETELPSDVELRHLAESYGHSNKPKIRPKVEHTLRTNWLLENGYPIEQVSEAAAREKSIRQGHVSTLQMWWARRPMGVCRSALFAALCPSPEVVESRPDLLKILECVPGDSTEVKLHWLSANLADWKHGIESQILRVASALLSAQSHDCITVLDTFAGGGSIPIEAARLGLNSLASDLNPVAVVALKAALEILPRRGETDLDGYYGLTRHVYNRIQKLATGLYDDTSSAQHLAFLWCKSVKCPECGRVLPLMKDKWLAKGSRPTAVRVSYNDTIRFSVYSPASPADLNDADSGTVGARGAVCPWCRHSLGTDELAGFSRTNKMADLLYAKLVLRRGEKRYEEVSARDEHLAGNARLRKCERKLSEVPDGKLDPNGIRHMWVMQYGIQSTADLYSHRQKIALLELVHEIERQLETTALPNKVMLRVLLTLTFNRVVMYGTRHAWWQPNGEFPANMYVRQGIPMVWNFVEIPISSPAAGGWLSASTWIKKVAEHLQDLPRTGRVWLGDAAKTPLPPCSVDLVAIDPPYFDSITYAYLSDPFYVWMKALLGDTFAELFRSELTPKEQEAIVDRPHKAAPRPKSAAHFRGKMEQAFREAARVLKPGGRLLLMYGHKKLEAWEAVLTPLLQAGFVPTVSWPIQMERKVKFRHGHIDALSSSCIVLCERDSAQDKEEVSWALIEPEFKATVRRALYRYQRANFMGTDLASALIAPAFAFFKRYKVLHPDGAAWTVEQLLAELPRIADDCEVEAIKEDGAPDGQEILAALGAIDAEKFLTTGGWTAHAAVHQSLRRAAQYAEALYEGNKAKADKIWNDLDESERKSLFTALRAAAFVSPPGSLGRQLAYAGLGRATMLLRVN